MLLKRDISIGDRVKDTRLEAKAKDSPSEDRPSRGQGTGMLEAKDQGRKRNCSPKKRFSKIFFRRSQKKRSPKIFFRRSPKKKKKKNNKRSPNKFFRQTPKTRCLKKLFQAIYKILTIQKIVLSSSRGQAIFEDLRLRGQGLQNVSSRPRTSSGLHLW